MYRSAQPSPMTFLTDRTQQSIQQQNTVVATPKSASTTHNPYSASVIPANPEEVLLHRSMSQLDAYNYGGRSPYASTSLQGHQYGGHSPLSYNSSFVEFPPVSPMLQSSFRAPSPYSEPPALETPLVVHTKQALTKVYVGGRPVAVPSAAQPVVEVPPTPTATAVESLATPAVPAAQPTAAHQLPNDVVVRIQFRRTESRFLLRDVAKKTAGMNITSLKQLMDTHVVVDGDRGEDIGRIVFVDENGCDDAVPTKIPKVQRIASREEVQRMEALRQDELRALEFAQQQAARLFPAEQLSIDDATFQFDKQKLTLWYRVPDRVYFVPLLKTLNQAYRCRIWMERIDDRMDQ
ncbi:Hypothetical protein, putative [Bodo saltans]|uniref:PSP1 C-terminal domain-containing protein n=1 Tax=Bodo saltans TaxID=75058 RepID=A0A0S4JEW1_BODSA|nr:Hypothetical protein, putative [Bodo saltans]|eukprot:CUG87713.1 Hypothetical protein, putative [Bodo saltans]